MYDWELESFLLSKNYTLSSKEYLEICDVCPQIQRSRYNAFDDSFLIWTDEHCFKFFVYYDGENID